MRALLRHRSATCALMLHRHERKCTARSVIRECNAESTTTRRTEHNRTYHVGCRWHQQVQGIPQGAATSSLLCGLHLRTLVDTVFLPLIRGAGAHTPTQRRRGASQGSCLPPAKRTRPTTPESAFCTATQTRTFGRSAEATPAPAPSSKPPPLLLNMTDDFLLLACDGEAEGSWGAACAAALAASDATDSLLSKSASLRICVCTCAWRYAQVAGRATASSGRRLPH